jgi:hypothetical protein
MIASREELTMPTATQEPRHRFIFIAGHHRSGTSLLHSLIKGHPDVSGFSETGAPKDEGQHLQTAFKPARAYGGPGKYVFDIDSHMDETHPLATPDTAQRLFGEWAQHWDLRKDWLLEKSPPNIVRTRFLQALFPNSTFIAVLRHPVAVAYATQKWSKTAIASLLDHTLRGYEVLQRDMAHLRRVHVIRYERLVAQPAREIGSIFELLGLPNVPIQHDVRTGIDRQYLACWDSDNRGRGLISDQALSDLEERSRRLGYSLIGGFDSAYRV